MVANRKRLRADVKAVLRSLRTHDKHKGGHVYAVLA